MTRKSSWILSIHHKPAKAWSAAFENAFIKQQNKVAHPGPQEHRQVSEHTVHTSSAHVGDITKGQTVGFTQILQKERKEEAECEPTSRALVIGPGL